MQYCLLDEGILKIGIIKILLVLDIMLICFFKIIIKLYIKYIYTTIDS